MAGEKPGRRVPLRQLLTQTQKCAHDLCEQLHSTLQLRITDFRDLSRPVRRRSHYPTVLTLLNALTKLEQAEEETTRLAAFLLQQLEEVRDHANRERVNRR
jgi:hypothetical protein